ncbi:ABC transporter permease DevC [Chamaesiphon sp. OTE_75_metabat_556]|jgi:putative ABC transport system permease protein|uniref:ABC transporter permease DevC n=1 Tax=Chamaesiphon sp. OTE_75_metabat_556 TaxID=2964692 RepID=UPI00286B07F5|nr:ABC transporter permease DevC [Chamaesiphon sp. OTE_75_metabat_556]
MFKKIPLAWLQLSHEKIRLLVAIAGISFADILMFMQLGFRDALFDSAVKFHTNVNGDVFLVSPQSTALIAMKSFPRRRLYQSLAFKDVESVTPIYLGFGIWKNPIEKNTRQIMVVGFNPADKQLFQLPGISENIAKMQLPDTYLFDEKSREQFGDIPKIFNSGQKVQTEIDGRKIDVGGLFTLGASFGADGNLMTSDTNFARLFKQRDRGLIDVGVIKLKPGADVKAAVAEIDAYLPSDVKVMSKEQFIEFEKSYWQSGTSIGFIFTLGTIMGFIVGIVIVYQILYTDVADHLSEYATLKAMGYTDFYLLTVVFQEAIILSIVGFFPGMLAAVGLYAMTRNATSLPLLMTVARATTVLILTMIMCTISGAIAVRKLRAADPADMF